VGITTTAVESYAADTIKAVVPLFAIVFGTQCVMSYHFFQGDKSASWQCSRSDFDLLCQTRSQDCKLGGGSFSVWGQTYFEYYYTVIACWQC